MVSFGSILATSAAPTAQAAAEIPGQPRYFDQTGHSIGGVVLGFYNRTGGEERHGLPLTELISVKGKYQQFFERSVLEFNPNYAGTEYEVKQLPLGVLDTANRNLETVTPFPNNPNQWYFPETSHSLNFGFLEFWRNHGERDSLGLPISEEMEETDAKGQKITVQYFEYARLEYHPDLAKTNNAVQIGQLGRKQAGEQVTSAELERVPLANLNQPRSVRIPSLMIHYVRVVDIKKDPLGFGLSVTPENFVKFADWLKQNGYNTVTALQINDYLRYGVALPSKPVNLRFDDGHSSMWFVYEELKKRGMTATFYVISQRLELTPAQWQQIDADGFEVAAHTRTHPDLRGSKDLEGEIKGSKLDLETMLGHPVRDFSYPYGKYGPTILRLVQEAGYEVAVTTNGGYGWTPSSYFTQPTLGITGDDTVTTFANKILAAPKAAINNNTPTADTSSTEKPAPTKVPTKAPVKTNTPTKAPAPMPKTPISPPKR
ncbi:MAG: polysaccharide deacetylase family protein [Chloroflexota bacterium]|nr:polysaccharide deacetylase family protein [Chloroflexota bacterium]